MGCITGAGWVLGSMLVSVISLSNLFYSILFLPETNAPKYDSLKLRTRFKTKADKSKSYFKIKDSRYLQPISFMFLYQTARVHRCVFLPDNIDLTQKPHTIFEITKDHLRKINGKAYLEQSAAYQWETGGALRYDPQRNPRHPQASFSITTQITCFKTSYTQPICLSIIHILPRKGTNIKLTKDKQLR